MSKAHLIKLFRVEIVELKVSPPVSDTWNDDNSDGAADSSTNPVGSGNFFRIFSQIGGFAKDRKKQVGQKSRL